MWSSSQSIRSSGAIKCTSINDSDEKAPEAANAETPMKTIRTFTKARLDAANAGGGFGRLRSKHEDQGGESELLRHG
nr:hypothetical protein CFP56_66447 [Quercus suber]